MQAKGYRVGLVYGEALSMAWFILELTVKSMDLELAQVPQSEFGRSARVDKPALQGNLKKQGECRLQWQRQDLTQHESQQLQSLLSLSKPPS